MSDPTKIGERIFNAQENMYAEFHSQIIKSHGEKLYFLHKTYQVVVVYDEKYAFLLTLKKRELVFGMLTMTRDTGLSLQKRLARRVSLVDTGTWIC